MTSSAIFLSGVAVGVIWSVLVILGAIWLYICARKREHEFDQAFSSRPATTGTVIAFRRK